MKKRALIILLSIASSGCYAMEETNNEKQIEKLALSGTPNAIKQLDNLFARDENVKRQAEKLLIDKFALVKILSPKQRRRTKQSSVGGIVVNFLEPPHLTTKDLILVKSLIKTNIGVNEKGVGEATPLMASIIWNCTDLVDLLLKHPNIDVNKGEENYMKTSPIGTSARLGNIDAAKLLLKHKNIEVNKIYDSKTALDDAYEHKDKGQEYIEMIQLLKAHGAKTAAELEEKNK